MRNVTISSDKVWGWVWVTENRVRVTYKSEHQDRSFLESEVFNGLRVWHISGMIIGAVMIIIISLCCLCKCRIPRWVSEKTKKPNFYFRTRKEIEANAKRRRDRRKRRNGKEDPEEG